MTQRLLISEFAFRKSRYYIRHIILRSSAKIILIAGPMLTSALQALEKLNEIADVVVIDDQQDLSEELRMHYINSYQDLLTPIPVISEVHSLTIRETVHALILIKPLWSQGYKQPILPRCRWPTTHTETISIR